MSHGASALASRFCWAEVTLKTLEQNLGRSSLEASLLCSTRGTDTDFTGGAAAWEHASQMLESAGNALQLSLQLQSQSICASGFQMV